MRRLPTSSTIRKKKKMRILVMRGDCLDQMRELESESVDGVLCDPPYGLKSWTRTLTIWVTDIRLSGTFNGWEVSCFTVVGLSERL